MIHVAKEPKIMSEEDCSQVQWRKMDSLPKNGEVLLFQVIPFYDKVKKAHKFVDIISSVHINDGRNMNALRLAMTKHAIAWAPEPCKPNWR